MKRSWPYFAWLLVVAVMIHYRVHYLVVLIAVLVLFFRGWWWLCERYPRTIFVLTAFLSGLFGGRRRRW